MEALVGFAVGVPEGVRLGGEGGNGGAPPNWLRVHGADDVGPMVTSEELGEAARVVSG